jgi:hypothetical protein
MDDLRVRLDGPHPVYEPLGYPSFGRDRLSHPGDAYIPRRCCSRLPTCQVASNRGYRTGLLFEQESDL